MVAEFKQHGAATCAFQIDETMWQKDLDFIKAMIHKEIDVDLFGEAEALKGSDRGAIPQLRFAVGLVPGSSNAARFAQQRSTRAASTRAVEDDHPAIWVPNPKYCGVTWSCH